MFAALIIEPEYEPSKFEDFPGGLQLWILVAGGFAAFCLLIWLLARLIGGRGPSAEKEQRPWGFYLLASLLGGCGLTALALAMPWLYYALGWSAKPDWSQMFTPIFPKDAKFHFLALLAGVALYLVLSTALTAVLLPVLLHLWRWRWRRIWALAVVSMKEAVRSKVLWVFCVLVVIFMFASWFINVKPQYQAVTYVQMVFLAMTVLLLFAAGLVAALSIPADLRRQTIHTVLTKPVERFEIVIGRFLGYVLLMSGVLAVMTLLSLIYVNRNLDEEAIQESLRARVPIFGDLKVENGKSVGREWEYRSYIGFGGRRTDKPEQAIWTFPKLPAHLGGRETVRLEYEFDIFRTVKNRPEEEGKPVVCSFTFQTARWDPSDPSRLNEYQSTQAREYARPGRPAKSAIDNQLAEQFGYYEVKSQRVIDYHTLAFEVPGALFKPVSPAPAGRPALTIVVECQTPAQFLGVAKHDLYLLDDEGWVWLNFFKGAAGIWFQMCLVIGLAVTLSTYLSGIISFFSTAFLMGVGFFLPFIKELAARATPGGGAAEALLRLGTRGGVPIGAELDKTPTVLVAQRLDTAFSWVLGRVMYLFPDVRRFSLTEYVARGFDVPGSVLFWHNLVPLAGYLVCWAVLAYYLMKSREIAA